MPKQDYNCSITLLLKGHDLLDVEEAASIENFVLLTDVSGRFVAWLGGDVAAVTAVVADVVSLERRRVQSPYEAEEEGEAEEKHPLG